jgi:hypothetical protein
VRTIIYGDSTVGEGDRVELVRISDPYVQIPRGSKGTVVLVDGLGTVHVRWDDGTQLGLVPGVDRYWLVQKSS